MKSSDEPQTEFWVKDTMLDTNNLVLDRRVSHAFLSLPAVCSLIDELHLCSDMDTLLRRAVELAREELGLERCAIFLPADKGEFMIGTYGTNCQGQTTDERTSYFRVAQEWKSLSRQVIGPRPLNEWDGHKSVPLNKLGWIAITPIQSIKGLQGILVNDSAITDRPLDESQQENVAAFCSLVGNLMERKRSEEDLRSLTAHLHCILWSGEIDTQEGILRCVKHVHDEDMAQKILPLKGKAGQSYRDLWRSSWNSKDEAQMRRDLADTLLRGGTSYSHDFRCTNISGEERWLHEDMTLEYAGPQRWRAFGVCTDITDRKKAEQVQQHFEEHLKSLIEIDHAILTKRSMQEIVTPAFIYLCDYLHCQRVRVKLFDYEAREWQPYASLERKPNQVDHVQFGPNANYSIKAVKSYTQDSTATSNKLNGGAHEIHSFGSGTGTNNSSLVVAPAFKEISIPMLTGDELIGVIQLSWDTLPALTDDYLRTAREVAERLAVAVQTTRLSDQVQLAQEKLHALSQRLMDAQEVERRHIAHGLHDEVGQSLTAVKINLQVLQRDVSASHTPQLEDSINIVQRVLQQVRNLSLDLRPAILDDLGLVAALRWYLERQSQLSELDVRFTTNGIEERLPASIEITCFRVVQEAFTNIMRHAQARHVDVELCLVLEEDFPHEEVLAEELPAEVTDNVQALLSRNLSSYLHMVIRDDGVGFDVRAAKQRALQGSSLGFLSMEERVNLAGGRLEVESAPEAGAEVRVRFKINSSIDNNTVNNHNVSSAEAGAIVPDTGGTG